MTDHQIIREFQRITIWKNKEQRAPHKPLLLLLSLASVQRGESRLMSYKDVEDKLKRLLIDYGPQRTAYHPEFPFWRLQNDGDFWEIPESSAIMHRLNTASRNTNVTSAMLRSFHAKGGFSTAYYDYLKTNPDLVNRLVSIILEAHFPPSLHESILDAVQLPWISSIKTARARSASFRNDILRNYRYRCAVCGFDGRLEFSDLGLEAAHIKWYMAGGPDSEDNGIALCILHHRLFDRGAIGISDDYRILVSQLVHGGQQVVDTVIGFSGKDLSLPLEGTRPPRESYVHWHRKEVFKGPPRKMV